MPRRPWVNYGTGRGRAGKSGTGRLISKPDPNNPLSPNYQDPNAGPQSGPQSGYDAPGGDTTPWFDTDAPYQADFPDFDPGDVADLFMSGGMVAPARVAGIGAEPADAAAAGKGPVNFGSLAGAVPALLGLFFVYHGWQWAKRGFRPMR